MSAPSPARWYVVRTKPRCEGFAADGLRSREIEIYFPRLVVESWARPRLGGVAAAEPLFPGYLFAHLDLRSQYGAAAWTPGVRGLVGFSAGEPAAVDESVVELLRLRAGGGDILRPREILHPGEAVEIRQGPFAGLLGVIERPVDAAGRVRILLELLQRQTRVELRADAVFPL